MIQPKKTIGTNHNASIATALWVLFSALTLIVTTPFVSANDIQPSSPDRGLLALGAQDRQPMKGVYFFPGEAQDNINLYTAHPKLQEDQHWNTQPETRSKVSDRIIATHANVIVMSYWSNMPQWSPMTLAPDSLRGVIDATEGRPIRIMPAIESGFDPNHPETPHWEFAQDFPHPVGKEETAPGLIQRIMWLLALFDGRMNHWVQMYDRDGVPRYAVHILHAYADHVDPIRDQSLDATFANSFDAVANEIYQATGFLLGFTLDVIPGPCSTYTAEPKKVGDDFERTAAILAVQGFASEVFSRRVIDGQANGPPYDNNRHNLPSLIEWKAQAVDDWVRTGVPVILDVSSGMDGRFVWKDRGSGFWGDNLDYTDDRWRNALSQLKGRGIKGITFNTWNGYTEGYAAVPTVEHDTTIYSWLTDLYEPDPRECNHMHYVNGARSHRTYGAICEKWAALDGDRGLLGAPVTDELASTRGRVSHFEYGSIFWGPETGAHEIHGLIEETYRQMGSDNSCLGLPVSDEESLGTGRISRFQNGAIRWKPGETRGRADCR